VLREGTEDDVRYFVDIDVLLDLWDELVLPPTVRQAWADWFARGEELAVDKVLAIFGRAEARDFIDFAALEPKYGFERLCELAAEKDTGFSAHVRRNALQI
jgi:hypothetical protein